MRRARGEKDNIEVHGYIPKTTQLKKESFDIAGFIIDDTSLYKQVVNSIRQTDDDEIINNRKKYN